MGRPYIGQKGSDLFVNKRERKQHVYQSMPFLARDVECLRAPAISHLRRTYDDRDMFTFERAYGSIRTLVAKTLIARVSLSSSRGETSEMYALLPRLDP